MINFLLFQVTMQPLYSRRRINALKVETWTIEAYLELMEYPPQADLQEPLKQLFSVC